MGVLLGCCLFINLPQRLRKGTPHFLPFTYNVVDIHLLKRSVWKLTSCKTSRCLFTKSCPTLCDPTNCSPPGSSIHGILQARTLEWVAISSSRGSSRPRDETHISCIGWNPHLLRWMKVVSHSSTTPRKNPPKNKQTSGSSIMILDLVLNSRGVRLAWMWRECCVHTCRILWWQRATVLSAFPRNQLWVALCVRHHWWIWGLCILCVWTNR